MRTFNLNVNIHHEAIELGLMLIMNQVHRYHKPLAFIIIFKLDSNIF